MRYGLFSLFVPAQAVGASLVYFDLWNGSSRDLWLSSLAAIKDGSQTNTGALGVQLFLTRTSAVGTGGTANTSDGATLTACTITALQQRALPTGVTARLTPTGGATAGAVLAERQVFGEETAVANYEALEFCPSLILIPEGTGIRVVQGSVAATGRIGFNGIFY